MSGAGAFQLGSINPDKDTPEHGLTCLIFNYFLCALKCAQTKHNRLSLGIRMAIIGVNAFWCRQLGQSLCYNSSVVKCSVKLFTIFSGIAK